MTEIASHCAPSVEDPEIPTTYVDWHCRKCGNTHEATGPTSSYPCKCPACGEAQTQRGFPVLPVNKAWCDSSPRQYNLCGGEKEIQVYLVAATGERAAHAMNPDHVPDCDDDPITVARAVLDICNTKYLYCGGKDRIVAVLAAMEKCEDMSEKNRASNRLHELRKRIVCAVAEYADLVEANATAHWRSGSGVQ